MGGLKTGPPTSIWLGKSEGGTYKALKLRKNSEKKTKELQGNKKHLSEVRVLPTMHITKKKKRGRKNTKMTQSQFPSARKIRKEKPFPIH